MNNRKRWIIKVLPASILIIGVLAVFLIQSRSSSDKPEVGVEEREKSDANESNVPDPSEETKPGYLGIRKNTFVDEGTRGRLIPDPVRNSKGEIIHRQGHFKDGKTMLATLLVPYDTPQVELQLRKALPDGSLTKWKEGNVIEISCKYRGRNHGENDVSGRCSVRDFLVDPNTGSMVKPPQLVPMENIRFATVGKDWYKKDDIPKYATDLMYFGETYKLRFIDTNNRVVGEAHLTVPKKIAKGEVAVFRFIVNSGVNDSRTDEDGNNTITGKLEGNIKGGAIVKYQTPQGENHAVSVQSDGSFSIIGTKLGGSLAVWERSAEGRFMMKLNTVSKRILNLPADADLSYTDDDFVSVKVRIPKKYLPNKQPGQSVTFHLGPPNESEFSNKGTLLSFHRDKIYTREWIEFFESPVVSFSFVPGNYGVYASFPDREPELLGLITIPEIPPKSEMELNSAGIPEAE